MAVAVPRLTQRLGNGLLLAGGITVTLIGMAWLSRLSSDTPYLTGVALPMVLIGAGQGGTLSPLTASGIAGVASEDAGAASGLVDVAHQLGGSLGLGFLVTVFAAAGGGTLDARNLLAHRVATSLTAGTAMLGLALVLVVALIVPSRKVPAHSYGERVKPSAASDNSALRVAEAVTEGPPLPQLPTSDGSPIRARPTAASRADEPHRVMTNRMTRTKEMRP